MRYIQDIDTDYEEIGGLGYLGCHYFGKKEREFLILMEFCNALGQLG